MKVRVTYHTGDMNVDEEFTGKDADEIVAAMKQTVARRAGFVVRVALGGMSTLGFAQEAVKRYNASSGTSLPIPQSCAEFIKLGQQQGILAVVEP